MKTKDERMTEFVIYHMNGDGECNNVVLKEWAKRRNLNMQDRYDLAILFSITYCVQSAIILFEEQKKNGGLYKNQISNLKPHILFQSDRKYMKMKDNFERAVEDYQNNHKLVDDFLYKTKENGVINLKKAIKYVSSWVMYGRFASFLFLETFVELTGIDIENTTIDWKNGDTATSGLLNVFGYDDEANNFDKTGRLPFNTISMDKMLYMVINKTEQMGGDSNVTKLETSLCAYRKFYKGSRYNGFYLDRMLEEIYLMEREYPKISRELIEIRNKCFDSKYLGEIGGWRGIRKELKKYYINTGNIT